MSASSQGALGGVRAASPGAHLPAFPAEHLQGTLPALGQAHWPREGGAHSPPAVWHPSCLTAHHPPVGGGWRDTASFWVPKRTLTHLCGPSEGLGLSRFWLGGHFLTQRPAVPQLGPPWPSRPTKMRWDRATLPPALPAGGRVWGMRRPEGCTESHPAPGPQVGKRWRCPSQVSVGSCCRRVH